MKNEVLNRFKIGFIIPYFGKMPNYFNLFLKSCEYNQDYTWIILTDDTTEYIYPKNVKKISMSFDKCREIIQSKFDFKISLKKPKKLCDYKCAYGYIFSEYLKEFDFWGHCDMDIIFGDLNSFITHEMLIKYDKLFPLGHLALYRNNEVINKIFMKKINGIDRYKEVFTNENMCSFDEWSKNNINEIFLKEKIPTYLQSNCADIGAFNCSFINSIFDAKLVKWEIDDIRNSLFKWKNGKIIRIWNCNGEKFQREYSYIHLQKRNMYNLIKDIQCKEFYIVPNKFICFNNKQENKYIMLYKIKCLFNYKLYNKKISVIKYKMIVFIRGYQKN